jgi:hypothetical protein
MVPGWSVVMITGDYAVVLEGALGPRLRAAFDAAEIVTRSGTTTLVLREVDQAALHAVLARARDLGLILLEVRHQPPPG